MPQPSLIRDIHQVSVLNLLRRLGTTSRARLAHELGLTRSTLTSLVNGLIADGYVVESGETVVRHGTGRPGVGLTLDADGAYFVGAEIGYGHVRVVAMNLAAAIVARAAFPFASEEPDGVIRQAARTALRLCREAGLDPGRIKGLGVAVPGTTLGDRIALAPGLGWSEVAVGAVAREEVPWPVLVENNANAAALAEAYLGDADAGESLVFLHLGKGIGSGIVIGNEIYRGAFGAAGEIGNVRLALDGPTDRKGNRGTFEGFASESSVLRLYQERGGRGDDVAAILRDLALGSAAAVETLAVWRHWLGQVILMLVNVLNPRRIVLGGPLAPLALEAMPDLQDVVRRERLPGSDRVELRGASLGDVGHAWGGAMLVYHTMFGLPGWSVPVTAGASAAEPRPAAGSTGD